ncbi:MAG TPA: chorismate-binding protein, partial [Candidatus Thalassarchaeaceae archaeon]|nr:chorismate-binding protein [Candidatus Thalassarchaeaceae archaeon]
GGFAGLLTYDLVQWTEPVRLQNLPEPSTLLGILFRVDRWIVHNREEGILSILSLHPDSWFNNCSEVIDEWILNRLTTTITPAEQSPSHSTISDDEHCNIVDTVRSAIKDGDFYQLNYGRIWSGKISEPWAVFKRLLKSNPAPYSGWLSIPDHDYVVASVSPELLLSIQGDELSTRPIKGTRPRARRRDRDEALKRELVSSRKEVSEHMMLVDLERNDLGKVCRVGSVKWHDWRIESHPNVHHLVSDVRGRLREDCDSWDAVQALFPGGSITGCPKTATIAAIDELEATPRHAWTGSLGFHDPRSGVACWNILIRTLEAKRVELGDWQAKVQAGGGLVYDSISTQEVEEAKWKAQALLDAAWGVSESNIPKGKMSIECVPALDERTESLLQSLNSKSQICISPAEPIRWIHGDAPLPSTKMGERRLLFVDNLDSFSWNIVHVAAQLGAEVVIVEGRGELAMSGAKHIVESIKPTHIIIGPGPGRPSHSPLTQVLAKNSIEGKIINEAGDIIPLLGICLG